MHIEKLAVTISDIVWHWNKLLNCPLVTLVNQCKNSSTQGTFHAFNQKSNHREYFQNIFFEKKGCWTLNRLLHFQIENAPNIVKVWKMPSIPHPYFIFIVFKAGLFFDFFPVGEVILKGLQAHPMGTTDNGLMPTSEQKVNLHLKNLRKIVIRHICLLLLICL